MKKLILLVFISTIGVNVLNAQDFSQGEIALAARVSNLDLNFTKFKDQNTKMNFNLGLKGDYFLIDNLTLTAGFDYVHEQKYGQKGGVNSLLGEIGSKYYFWEYLYGGIFYQGLYDYKRINSRGKIEFGSTFYIADNAFIEPAIYFLRGEYATGVKKVETFSQFGLAISIGVNF